jgi:hypothetical protein
MHAERTRKTRHARKDVTLRWAVVGALALVLMVTVDVFRCGRNIPVSLIHPGAKGPSAAVVSTDFPDLEQPDDIGLDGQMYYAIARNPLHLREVAKDLDRPRYRLQRPLLPLLAWAMQPTGGGVGLVWALFFVNLAGIVLGALATGRLSTNWQGPPWAAAMFPLLPGAFWSLRFTLSDALALALALMALVLADRDRYMRAITVAMLAVLAKEQAILLFLGWAIHRRTKRDLLLLVVPTGVIIAWMGWLHVQLPADVNCAQDLGIPFMGLIGAWQHVWSQGNELAGMACTLGGLILGATAIWLRRFGHPLCWAIAVQLGFMLVMGLNPTAVKFGATRMAMPIMILSLIALLTPRAQDVEIGPIQGKPSGTNLNGTVRCATKV